MIDTLSPIVITQNPFDTNVYTCDRFGTRIMFRVREDPIGRLIDVWSDSHPVDTMVVRPDDNPADRMFTWVDTHLPF